MIGNCQGFEDGCHAVGEHEVLVRDARVLKVQVFEFFIDSYVTDDTFLFRG